VGQKVHPYGFRLGYNKDWHSHWFAKKQFGEFLLEDLKLKRDLKQRFTGAGVSHVDIERAANRLKIIIYTSRPGIIIGRKGAEIDKLKSDLSMKTGREVLVSIQEIHKPELNAQLQAEKIAAQLEKRIAFRRAMRKAVEESLRFGAQGIKVKVSGRLNGAEIARSEWHLQGRLPLHTLSDRSGSRFGSTVARSWIPKPRWPVAPDRIRSTKPAPVNASVDRAHAENVKADRTAGDRGRTTSSLCCLCTGTSKHHVDAEES
jgi:small subunit ribosomal protein S3